MQQRQLNVNLLLKSYKLQSAPTMRIDWLLHVVGATSKHANKHNTTLLTECYITAVWNVVIVYSLLHSNDLLLNRKSYAAI